MGTQRTHEATMAEGDAGKNIDEVDEEDAWELDMASVGDVCVLCGLAGSMRVGNGGGG